MLVLYLGQDYHLIGSQCHWWVENKHTRAILDATVEQFDNWFGYEDGVELSNDLHYPFGKPFTNFDELHNNYGREIAWALRTVARWKWCQHKEML